MAGSDRRGPRGPGAHGAGHRPQAEADKGHGRHVAGDRTHRRAQAFAGQPPGQGEGGLRGGEGEGNAKAGARARTA